MRKDLQADGMLLLVALAWGASNYLISICLTEMGPLTLNMLRFFVAFLAVALVGFKRLLKTNRVTLKYAFLMGIFLTGNYFFVNIGIANTSLSNSGFYCGLQGIFVPLVAWAIYKIRPERKLFFVLGLCLCGIFLMSLKDDFSVNAANMKGDFFCMCCSLCYTGNILITDKAVKHEGTDAFNLGALQIGFVCLFSSLLAFIFEEPAVPQSSATVYALLFLGVLCTGLAYVIQPIAQQYTSETHVGLILSLEPVFCAIIAFLFAGEILFAHNYIGMALLMSGIVILEISPNKKLQ